MIRNLTRAAALIFLVSVFPACGAEEKPITCSGTCLSLTELFTFTDPEYNFHITGKVKNFSPANAESVLVTADFFSDPDHQLPLSSGSQSLPPIPGGEGFRSFDIWSPAVRLLPGSGGIPAVFFETLVRGTAGGTEPITAPVLRLEGLRLLTDVRGRYHVRAKAVNPSSTPVEMVYFTVSFYRDRDRTELIARLRKGFGRFLGTPLPTPGQDNSGSPEYLLDLWHPEINRDLYPEIEYRAELSQ